MATTELTVMLARLLARGRFSVPPQKVRAVSVAAVRPKDGLQVVLDAEVRPRAGLTTPGRR